MTTLPRRRYRPRAKRVRIHAEIARLSRAGWRSVDIAQRLGEPVELVWYARRKTGVLQPKYLPRPGSPHRARRLLQALQGYRQQCGLPWPELARRAGTYQGTVWAWYAGKRRPSEMSLDRVERFLKGVTSDPTG